MSGCYVYHKWQYVKSLNAPDITVRSKSKRFRKFLRRAGSTASEGDINSDIQQMRLEAEGNFNTPATTPDDILERAITTDVELDDDVFGEVQCRSHQSASQNKQSSSFGEESENVHSSNYYSVHL